MNIETWRFSRKENNTVAFGENIFTVNAVRDRELHKKSEVVYTQPNQPGIACKPYKPGLFPLGRCELLRVERYPNPDIYIGPVLFVFDAGPPKVKIANRAKSCERRRVTRHRLNCA